MGTGIARGFLAALDAAWMIRSWSQGGSPLDVLAERSVYTVIIFSIQCTSHIISEHIISRIIHHLSLFLSVSLAVCVSRGLSLLLSVSSYPSLRESIYRLLPQTTPENLQKNFGLFTVDPTTRYLNINRLLMTPAQVQSLISARSFSTGDITVQHLIYVLQVRHLVDTGEGAGLNTDCDIIRLPSPRTLREGEFFCLILSDVIALLSHPL